VLESLLREEELVPSLNSATNLPPTQLLANMLLKILIEGCRDLLSTICELYHTRREVNVPHPKKAKLGKSETKVVRESSHQERLTVELVQETLNVFRGYRLQSSAPLSSLFGDVRRDYWLLVAGDRLHWNHLSRRTWNNNGRKSIILARLHQSKIWDRRCFYSTGSEEFSLLHFHMSIEIYSKWRGVN
jgi:hypothetical protein